MADIQFFFAKEGYPAAVNIESSFGVRVTSVRGLNPPQPKPLFTRDWAAEHGVDVHIPTSRKRKSSEVVMTIYTDDEYARSAKKKYIDFCDFVFDGKVTYHDTLQNSQVELIYDSNKPAWYQFVGEKRIMFEVTFLNPTGEVVNLEV